MILCPKSWANKMIFSMTCVFNVWKRFEKWLDSGPCAALIENNDSWAFFKKSNSLIYSFSTASILLVCVFERHTHRPFFHTHIQSHQFTVPIYESKCLYVREGKPVGSPWVERKLYTEKRRLWCYVMKAVFKIPRVCPVSLLCNVLLHFLSRNKKEECARKAKFELNCTH